MTAEHVQQGNADREIEIAGNEEILSMQKSKQPLFQLAIFKFLLPSISLSILLYLYELWGSTLLNCEVFFLFPTSLSILGEATGILSLASGNFWNKKCRVRALCSFHFPLPCLTESHSVGIKTLEHLITFPGIISFKLLVGNATYTCVGRNNLYSFDQNVQFLLTTLHISHPVQSMQLSFCIDACIPRSLHGKNKIVVTQLWNSLFSATGISRKPACC